MIEVVERPLQGYDNQVRLKVGAVVLGAWWDTGRACTMLAATVDQAQKDWTTRRFVQVCGSWSLPENSVTKFVGSSQAPASTLHVFEVME